MKHPQGSKGDTELSRLFLGGEPLTEHFVVDQQGPMRAHRVRHWEQPWLATGVTHVRWTAWCGATGEQAAQRGPAAPFLSPSYYGCAFAVCGACG